MESVVIKPPKRQQILDDLFRVIIVIFSSAIYSIAVAWFLEPANLVSIGLTGAGQILNRLFLLVNIDIPVGVFVLLTNIPLCIYGLKSVSPRFMIYTVLSIIVQSVFLLGWLPQVNIVDDFRMFECARDDAKKIVDNLANPSYQKYYALIKQELATSAVNDG